MAGDMMDVMKSFLKGIFRPYDSSVTMRSDSVHTRLFLVSDTDLRET